MPLHPTSHPLIIFLLPHLPHLLYSSALCLLPYLYGEDSGDGWGLGDAGGTVGAGRGPGFLPF